MRDATGMLTYVILLLLGAVEIIFAMLLVKAVARIPWGWLRWFAGILCCAMSALLSLGIAIVVMEGNGQYAGHWRSWFHRDYPFPTLRLFVLGLCSAFPALAVLFVARGLCWEREHRVPRARLWPLKLVLKWLGGIVVLTGILVAINDWLIRREIAAFEDRGRTLAASVAPPQIPNEENGATLYERAVSRFGETAGRSPPKGFPGDPQLASDDAWQTYVADHREALDELRQATQRSKCRFTADWSTPSVLHEPSAVVDYLSKLAQMMHAEGVQQLLAGNADIAYANAATLRRLAEHMAADPRMVVQLNGFTAEHRAMLLMEHALFVRLPTPEEEKLLLRPSFEFRTRLEDAMVWAEAETCTGMADVYLGRIDEPGRDGIPGYRAVRSANLMLSRLFFARDDLYAIPRHFERYRRRAGLTYVELADPKQVEDFELKERYQCIAWGGLITTKAIPMHDYLPNFYANVDACRRLADFGLSISREPGLDALVSSGTDGVAAMKRPLDPRDAKPLRLAAADGGIVIYSIGLNRQDDGGQESARPIEGDQTFCLGEAFRVRRLEKKSD